MGMYTELVLKCTIKDETPDDVVRIIKSLINGDEIDARLPSHDFFKCGRFPMVLSCSSFYHHPSAVGGIIDNYIFVRSDLKDYDNEIDKFIDWLKPYISNREGECIGWTWYEEEDKPTLLIM